jgi:hypothetical protein
MVRSLFISAYICMCCFYFSAAYVLMCFNFIYVLLCFVLCFYIWFWCMIWCYVVLGDTRIVFYSWCSLRIYCLFDADHGVWFIKLTINNHTYTVIRTLHLIYIQIIYIFGTHMLSGFNILSMCTELTRLVYLNRNKRCYH